MKIDRRQFLTKSVVYSAGAVLAPSLIAALDGLSCAPMIKTGFDESQIAEMLKRALKRGGDFSEVFIEEIGSLSFRISERNFSEATIGISQGVGIRTVDDDKNGYAYVNGYDFAKALEAADASAFIASNVNLKNISAPIESKAPDFTKVEIPISSIPESQKMQLMKTAEEAARSHSDIVKQVELTYYDQSQKRIIANSNGLRIENDVPLIWVVIEVLGEKNGVRHMGRSRLSAHQGFELFDHKDVVRAAKDAAEEAVVMMNAKPAPSGMMPVVIKSGWGGVLIHEAVGHGLEGDAIYRGLSIYSDKLGKKVGSDLVTMIDDSSWPNARGTTGFDDEGTSGKRNVLIEKGIVTGFMQDLISAKKLGMEPTGNGRRESYRYFPIPRMTNTFLDNGQSDPKDIIAQTKFGIYIDALSGGSVDTITGQFNFVVREAHLIENGQITAPVKGATLIGKGIDVLMNIDAVGNDLDLGDGTCGKGQWVPVTSGLPTVRVAKGITVGGTA